MNANPLTIEQILTWAEIHRQSTGKYPTHKTGDIPGTRSENWGRINWALRQGNRGLPGGSSLARLLAEKKVITERGQEAVHCARQPLTEEQILQWADAHFRRHGTWPTDKSGKVLHTDQTWHAINAALQRGARELPGGSSLPRLLALHRGVRNRSALPPLTEEQILAWADEHRAANGDWPSSRSGPIASAPGETWMGVSMALQQGHRTLPSGTSLAMLLAQKRGVKNIWTKPNFTIEKILAWADAFHARTGKWPTIASGPIPESPGDTWNAVHQALKNSRRGLRGGFTLPELLAVERGVRNLASIPPFNRKRILSWIDAHFRRHGEYPTIDSGVIPEAPEETWERVHHALVQGNRGLRGGSSLPKFLAKHRGKRILSALPPLTSKIILGWADAHFQRKGYWPTCHGGPVEDVPGESWAAIDAALRVGRRTLPGGSSLYQLLVKKRGVKTTGNGKPDIARQLCTVSQEG